MIFILFVLWVVALLGFVASFPQSKLAQWGERTFESYENFILTYATFLTLGTMIAYVLHHLL